MTGGRLELSEFGASPEYFESRPTSQVTNIRAVARLREGPGATVEAVLSLGRGAGASTVLEWRDGLARAGVAEAVE